MSNIYPISHRQIPPSDLLRRGTVVARDVMRGVKFLLQSNERILSVQSNEADNVARKIDLFAESADVIEMTDMRMIQCRNGLRFALEARFQVRIGRKMRGQNLDGYVASQPCVARPVHLSHAARAQRRLDLIRTEFRARGEGHQCAPL